MGRVSILIISALLVCLNASYAFDENVLPFGAYSSKHADKTDPYDDDMLTTLHDTLGFNVWNSGGFNEYQVGRWYNNGLMSIPIGVYADNDGFLIDSLTEAHYKFSLAQYMIVQAEDESSDYRFETNNGTTPDDTVLVYDESDAVMLDDLVITQTRQEHALHGWHEEVEYSVFLQMGYLRESWTNSSDIIGWFRAIPVDDTTDVRLDRYITAGELPSDSTLTLLYLGQYAIRATADTSWKARNIRFQFIKPDSHTVMIDYFKFHCQQGDNLVEDHLYDDQIIGSAGRRAYEGKIHGWYLREEPNPGHYQTSGYVNSLIKQAMIDSLWSDSNRIEGMQPFIIRNTGRNDFIRLANPNRLFLHLYPYLGGGDNTALVLYTGTTWFDSLNNPVGLQASLSYKIARQGDGARDIIDTTISVNDWWYMPQAFASSDDHWREPTNSEFRCALYLGMCYQPRGIVYWKFDGTSNCPFSITDTDYEPTRLWTMIETEINTYIKAIDSTYLRLTWDDAYYVGADSAIPSGVWIDTIYAVSDTPNPDLGWFHVGQYTEGSDKYIMLVNRACSDTLGNAAPSITATVKFDPTNLGLGNYVYIIDLADSLRLAGADTGWVAIPETTYTAKMSDGTIPFSTVLGPGEGRLFKIVQASQISLKDTLAEPGFTYQGSIGIGGDIIIPSGSVFKVEGPARFKIPQCDSSVHKGLDSTLVEIICEGRMSFIGSECDSIYFTDLYNCVSGLLSDPMNPGDWYGIIDKSSDHDTLEYCSVQWAIKGYFADSASNALLEHCNISYSDSTDIYLWYNDNNKLIVDSCSIHHAPIGIDVRKDAEISVLNSDINNNEISGIYNCEGFLYLAGSKVEDNGIYGLDCCESLDSVYSTTFSGNGSYGIRIDKPKSSNYNSYLHEVTVVYTTEDTSTQYGIYIKDHDYISIDGAGVQGYYQGGIKLENSDCDVTKSDLSGNTHHGIYAYKSSPKVRECIFDDVDIGVKNYMLGSGIADLGKNIEGEYGYNSILDCNDWLIHFSGFSLGQETYILYAQQNWWGDSLGPDTSKFYDNADFKISYNPWLMENPQAKLASQLPLRFSLHQNYPNPFNPNTTLSFSLDKPAKTIVTIYNILGQKVATPVDDYLDAGNHRVIWDGKNSSGARVASGVYFYTIQSGEHFASEKMLLLR